MIGALRRRVRELAGVLAREHTEPGRLAASVFVGVVVGTTPLFGVHLPICVAFAWLLGLNKLVVYAAANLSVPPMVPLLGFASVQLGERILHGRWLTLKRADFTLASARAIAHQFFADWLLGGLVVGVAIGAAVAPAVYFVARRRAARSNAPAAPIDRAIDEARRRYDGLHPRFRYYARMKYRMDPCYRAIAPLVPEGAFVVDLGTGLGMLPVLLGVIGGGRRALGVDWDAAKLACGVHAARGLSGIELAHGDARTFALPVCDVVTLVDVLHYYDEGEQRALLGRCAAALRPGGRLLVREGDRTRAGGAKLTRFLEIAATKLKWNRGPAVRFRPIAELVAELEALGLRVRMDEVAGRLHPGNVLLVAER